MNFLDIRKAQLADLLAASGDVIETVTILRYLTTAELDWRVKSGKWQRPCKGVVVAHSGPLTNEQLMRVALFRSGPGAALAGLTAARLHGFRGFLDAAPAEGGPVFVLTAYAFQKPKPMPGLNHVLHRTKFLAQDVAPNMEPRRTRIARALVDGAVWMPTDRGALAVLAAGVQQRRTRIPDLRDVIDRMGATLPRRRLILDALADIEGGAQALSELDFTRKVVRQFRLPEPSRQAGRKDSAGRQRWIDVVWEEWKVVVEIDGAQHLEPLQYWDDMDRDDELQFDGYTVLRFPAWLVRQDPQRVASRILRHLAKAGYTTAKS